MAKLIGTAGHVDHGKTTLVHALTGIDADRLPEEKARGMTIDIGFAYIDLPGHGRVSIVDVPGHRKFLTNMLVGALGIRVALLCVAATESVMPQTREHLQILELLPVEQLVVAITQADLADEALREACKGEVEDLLGGSRFAGSPLFFTSAVTGEGLEALRASLSEALDKVDETAAGPWYLPIDRAFSVKGHGCVVTGTLARGQVRVGDKAILLPGGTEVRIRSIQTHGKAVDGAEAGQRTALNLSGVTTGQIRRGMTIGTDGAVFESDTIDGIVRWVEAPKSGTRIRLAIGSEDVMGRVYLEAGSEGAQFRLDAPVPVALDQPFIVRRYSPTDLLGGGKVTIPVGSRKQKPAPKGSMAEPKQAVLEVIERFPEGVPTAEVCRVLGKTPQDLGSDFEELERSGVIRGFGGLWFAGSHFDTASDQFVAALMRCHERAPQIAFQSREKVVAEAGLSWTGKPLDRIITALDREGKIEAQGTAVKHPSFKIALSAKQRALLDRVIDEIEATDATPPTPMEVARRLGVPIQAVEEILKLGRQAGEVRNLAQGVWFTSRQLMRIVESLDTLPPSFTAAEFKEALGTTRKYAIPLLEYFDSIRATTRNGDRRSVNRPVRPQSSK